MTGDPLAARLPDDPFVAHRSPLLTVAYELRLSYLGSQR
jgi:hypothetical protein